MKVGITGKAGFIGNHLFNHLKYARKDVELVQFEDSYFEDQCLLDSFVRQSDVVVHLAAMNRHGDPQVIYDTNIRLVNDLIAAMERNNRNLHVLFSSSTQEDSDNPYGKSKKMGRNLFEEWAQRSGSKFTAMIIPNVYGPFGKPYYNSAISTFSYQLTHNLEPKIEIDAVLKLIYINDLVKKVSDLINAGDSQIRSVNIEHIAEVKVSDILNKLIAYKIIYLDEHIIPEMNSYFDISLFNTFRSYIESDRYPMLLKLHSDSRGHLFESLRTRIGGQVFFSSTEKGVTRGNHFHTRKIERFCVVRGEAIIKIRKIDTDKIIEFQVSGRQPSFVDMPVFYTHNITNTGDEVLETLFWSNEFFNPDDSDTFFETV